MVEVTYRYGQAQGALAEVLGATKGEIAALRSRIRHLRKLGIPKRLPATGSGQYINYNWSQVMQIAIALNLVAVGQPPRHASAITASVLRQSPHGRGPEPDALGDMFVGVQPFVERPRFTMAFGSAAFHELCQQLETTQPALAVLNVSLCARRLATALAKT
jgi:hypothetical protein